MAAEKSVTEVLTEIGEGLRNAATADFTAQVLLDYSFEALDVTHEHHYLLHGSTPDVDGGFSMKRVYRMSSSAFTG